MHGWRMASHRSLLGISGREGSAISHGLPDRRFARRVWCAANCRWRPAPRVSGTLTARWPAVHAVRRTLTSSAAALQQRRCSGFPLLSSSGPCSSSAGSRRRRPWRIVQRAAPPAAPGEVPAVRLRPRRRLAALLPAAGGRRMNHPRQPLPIGVQAVMLRIEAAADGSALASRVPAVRIRRDRLMRSPATRDTVHTRRPRPATRVVRSPSAWRLP